MTSNDHTEQIKATEATAMTEAPQATAAPQATETTETAEAPGAAERRERRERDERTAPRLGMARTFGLDIVGPIALYHLLTNQGWSDVAALVTSGALPALGIGLDVVRGRRIGGLSLLVLGGIAISIIAALLTDDPRFVLLEGAVTSAVAGVFSLATLLFGRSLVEMFATGAAPEGTEHSLRTRALFERDDVRRFARRVTVVFAVVFFASAAAQAALAWWAPIGLAFAYNRFGFIPCLAVIAVGGWVLFRRARARGELDFPEWDATSNAARRRES